MAILITHKKTVKVHRNFAKQSNHSSQDANLMLK